MAFFDKAAQKSVVILVVGLALWEFLVRDRLSGILNRG